MFTTPNVSHVMCRVSRVTCHVSHVTCLCLFLWSVYFFNPTTSTLQVSHWRTLSSWATLLCSFIINISVKDIPHSGQRQARMGVVSMVEARLLLISLPLTNQYISNCFTKVKSLQRVLLRGVTFFSAKIWLILRRRPELGAGCWGAPLVLVLVWLT